MHTDKTVQQNKIQDASVTEVTFENVKCFYTNADQLRNKIDELKLKKVC